MGLEIFSLHNKVVSGMEGRMRDSNGRLYFGGLVMLVYLLIGALVFMRLEYPLERIERETHWEYRDQWTERLVAAGIEEVRCRTIIIVTILLVVYLVGGAFLFVGLELDHELKTREKVVLAVQRFKDATGASESEIDRLFSDIRDAALSGIWMEKNVTSSPNWSFGQAFFFAGTLVSTVGYGRVSPRTEHGKLFTIVYCIIGIPLTLALLSAIVARLKRPSQILRGFLNKRLAHLFHEGHIQNDVGPKYSRFPEDAGGVQSFENGFYQAQ
ncbi:Two pore potassium channel protein sup-9 [Trichostrongylus colubriformis]|uniref:Two pore potassium channel protein sup-9 n=1 Tax=Trichostrongylus colubriformis TaxID=6319 RepID=A0AAN8IFM1_TRICO